MRSRLLERIHPTELIEARAAAESKPLPAAPAPKPPNWGRDMIAFLRVEAPAVPAADHHRYDPDRLLPRHATMRRVTPARVVLDDIDTVTADVARAFATRPELRHDTAVLMALAPIVAMLKGSVA